MEGLTEKEVRSVFGQFHDSHNDRVKKLAVKHFFEMGEYKYSIFQYNMLCYLACTPITQKCLTVKLFTSAMQGDCHKLAKDTPDLFLYQALHFPYGSNQDSNFDVHVYHGNPLPHNNQAFCLKLVYL